jgi:hypothetical protein
MRRTYGRPVPRPTALRPTWDDLLNINVLPVTPAIQGVSKLVEYQVSFRDGPQGRARNL